MSYWYGLFIINLWSNGNSGVLYNAKQIQILSLIKILNLCLCTFYGVFVFCLNAILMVRNSNQERTWQFPTTYLCY